MKKTETTYYKNFGKESVRITVNEELPMLEYKPIKIEIYEKMVESRRGNKVF